MVESILATILKIRNKAMANSYGKMVGLIKVNGLMENNMEKDST
jgi:hypothetical protein